MTIPARANSSCVTGRPGWPAHSVGAAGHSGTSRSVLPLSSGFTARATGVAKPRCASQASRTRGRPAVRSMVAASSVYGPDVSYSRTGGSAAVRSSGTSRNGTARSARPGAAL